MCSELPYLPQGREILYVSQDDIFMLEAKNVADTLSLDHGHPIGAVIVKDNQIIARGANGSTYHEKHGCERKRRNIPTGTGYHLCEGCSPKNHAEQTALANCKDDPKGSDVYLWGHWWCCQSCWGKMIDAGIRNVYLPEGAEKMFRRK